jgi:hypothetical protein
VEWLLRCEEVFDRGVSVRESISSGWLCSTANSSVRFSYMVSLGFINTDVCDYSILQKGKR